MKQDTIHITSQSLCCTLLPPGAPHFTAMAHGLCTYAEIQGVYHHVIPAFVILKNSCPKLKALNSSAPCMPSSDLPKKYIADHVILE